MRTPGLPKDDIARALVARGRARKGAGQKLLLMASRGQCHSFSHRFQRRIPFMTSRHHSLSASRTTQRRFPDGFDIRPFESRAPILLAPRARRSSFPSSISLQIIFTFPLLDPIFRRPRLPTRSAGNLGPDRKLCPSVLSSHVALCIFIPSRHRPPSHLPHCRSLLL